MIEAGAQGFIGTSSGSLVVVGFGGMVGGVSSSTYDGMDSSSAHACNEFSFISS